MLFKEMVDSAGVKNHQYYCYVIYLKKYKDFLGNIISLSYKYFLNKVGKSISLCHINALN